MLSDFEIPTLHQRPDCGYEKQNKTKLQMFLKLMSILRLKMPQLNLNNTQLFIINYLFSMQETSIIEMNRHYPFDRNIHPKPSLVKLRRKFKDHEHLQLRTKIEFLSKLNHPSIIRIQKGFQSKKQKYFDIFLQYIPNSFKNHIQHLTLLDLSHLKQSLLNLCIFLLQKGIHPQITEEALGIHEGKLKYYLDLDYSNSVGLLDELTKAKELQINSLFSIYEQTLSRNPYKFTHQYQGFKNRGESTIKNIPRYSSCLNSPRNNFVYSYIQQQAQQTTRFQAHRSLARNHVPQSLQQITQFQNYPYYSKNQTLLNTNPYVSNRQSIFEAEKNKESKNFSKDVGPDDISTLKSKLVTTTFQQMIDFPKKQTFQELIKMKSCQSVENLAVQDDEEVRLKQNQKLKQGLQNIEHNSLSLECQLQQKDVIRPQNKDKKKQSMYHLAFGYKNDHLTKQFNVLFDDESLVPSESKGQILDKELLFQHQVIQLTETKDMKEINLSELKKQWIKREQKSKDFESINSRVKKALQKSEEMFKSYKQTHHPQL